MADDFTPAGNDWLRETPDGAVVSGGVVVVLRPVS